MTDRMPKTIILREDQLVDLIKTMVPEKRYPIEPSKVLLVKKFMDKTFHKTEPQNILGADGNPTTITFIELLAPDGTVLKQMYKDDAVDYLIDKFQNIYSDKERRNKFLGQMMEDWYNNKIGLYGSLSVNHL